MKGNETSATPDGSSSQATAIPSRGPWDSGTYDFASAVASKVAALIWAWADTSDEMDERYAAVQTIVDDELRSLAGDMSPAFAAAMSSGGQWRGIETAPKDQTDLLLWRSDCPPVVAGWYEGAWVDYDRASEIGGNPTHWQSLPAPPSVRDRSSEAAETSGSARQGKSPADLSATPMSPQPPSSTEGEEKALDAMLIAAVRFAAWGAGQGYVPHMEEADSPEEFLLVYSEATGDEHWETLFKRVSVALTSLRSELKAVREDRDNLSEQLRESAMSHLARDISDEQAATEISRLRERVEKLEEGRDFQLMLARIIHRHGKGLDLTETIAGARDLLARKGSLSPLRAALSSSQTETRDAVR